MNTETNTALPKLRFPEFEQAEAWEESSLNNIAEFRRGSFPQPYGEKKWYDSNGYPFIQVYDVDDNFRLKAVTKNYISKLAAEQSVFIRKGTLIVTLQGSIGKVAITQYDAYIDRTLLLFESFRKPLDINFFSYVIYLLFQIEKDKAPGGIIKTITKEVLGSFIINFPSLPEQKKIADTLNSLDEIISAHTAKLEALKTHKQGLMQRLFPAAGEKVPRLRFPEFVNAGDWEEKTLGEVTSAIFDGTHQTPTYVDSGIPFYSVENIISGKSNKFISLEDHQKQTIKNKPTKGDILITRIGNIGFSTIVDWDFEFSIYVTLAVVKQSAQFDSYYLHSFFQSPRYQKEIIGKSLMNAVPCKINMDELRKTKILLPTSNAEQKKIAACLSSLDEGITAQSQKIEALQVYKKGLMQSLFPNINNNNNE